MHKQKVLIVDDHPNNLLAMEEVLEKVGRQIIRASSGSEALALLMKHQFSLVLLDVQMPEMDGFEVASWIRSRQKTAHIPIIFVTAISKEEEYIFKGYQAGAIDYLFKPVEPSVLEAKVDFLLQLDLRNYQLEESLEKIRQLSDNNERLLKYVGEGIISLTPEGMISFANPAACNVFSIHRSSIEGKHISEYLRLPKENIKDWQNLNLLKTLRGGLTVHEENDVYMEIGGRKLPIEFTASAMLDEQGQMHGIAFSFQDISRRKEMETRLIKMAEYDSLTGLANRGLFENILSSAIARSDRSGAPMAVLCLDIDHFIRINDSKGFAFGDELLKQIGERIASCTRKADTIARYRADQFMILLEALENTKQAEFVAKKINTTLRKPFDINGEEVVATASIGIVLYPKTPANEESLLDFAATAMFDAKQSGRDTYRFHGQE